MKWSLNVEKTFATCYFSISLISVRVEVVQILIFFNPRQYFAALKRFSTLVHHTLHCYKKELTALLHTH